MSLELRPECKARLVEILLQVLPGIKITNSIFLVFESYQKLHEGDKTLSKNGKPQKELISYISDQPFYDFIHGRLATILQNSYEYESSSPTLFLKDLPGISIPELSNKLIEEFDSLPWEYTLVLELPKEFGEKVLSKSDRVGLSDTVFLSKYTESLEANFALETGNPKRDRSLYGLSTSSILGFGKNTWKKDGYYLISKVKGYIGHYGGTSPISDFQNMVKSIFGVLAAYRIIEVSRVNFDNIYSYSKLYILSFLSSKSKWTIENTFQTHTAISQGLASIKFNSNILEWTEGQQLSFIFEGLKAVSAILTNDAIGSKIALSSQWIFESFGNEDLIMSFVQSMTAAEVLLSDKDLADKVGVRELLGSRCAYLISGNHSEREEIFKNFQKIYDVRSHIVHQGKKRLEEQEFASLFQLRWMCSRIIQEEIRLLQKESK